MDEHEAQRPADWLAAPGDARPIDRDEPPAELAAEPAADEPAAEAPVVEPAAETPEPAPDPPAPEPAYNKEN